MAFNFRQHLARAARDINAMRRDLDATEFRLATEWTQTRIVRSTFGGEPVEIERWALAEHFLVRWLDWTGMLERWQRYTGRIESKLPANWSSIFRNAGETAQRLLTDRDLATTLLSRWVLRRMDDFPQSFESAEEAYNAAMDSDVRIRLARSFVDSPAKIDFAEALDARVEGAFKRSDRSVQLLANWFLGNYRHSSLRLSWLVPSGNDLFSSRLLRSEPMSQNWNRPAFNLDELENSIGPIARRVLIRMTSAIAEMGYDSFVDDITAGDFHSGPDSLLGDEVNLIPGRHPGKCAPLLVVVSRGNHKRSPLGFPSCMRNTKAHLTRCAGVTKLVVVLCDTWNAAEFEEEHYEELQAHAEKGVRFVFLSVGSPRTKIAPLAVEL